MAQRPGANTLRGGRNTYGSNILEGNWFEERYNPSRKAGVPAFFDSKYESTAHAQAHESSKQHPATIGAGVEDDGQRFDRDYHYENVIQYDNRSQPQTWASLSRTAHRDPKGGGIALEFRSATRMKPHPVTDDARATAAYRERWTLEGSAAFAEDRFRSTSNAFMAQNGAARKFGPRVVRVLPGAPLAVEKLREAVIAEAGSLAVDGIRRQLLEMDESGDGRLSREEFRWALSDFGVEMHPLELEKVFSWFDRDGNGFVDVDEFVAGIRGPMSEARARTVAAAWRALAGDEASLPAEEVAAAARAREDAARGAGEALLALAEAAREGVVSRGQFETHFVNVSAAVGRDHDFERLLPLLQ